MLVALATGARGEVKLADRGEAVTAPVDASRAPRCARHTAASKHRVT
jgi:hypothetical protein